MNTDTTDRPRLSAEHAYNRGHAAGDRFCNMPAGYPEPDSRVVADNRIEDWQRGFNAGRRGSRY